MVRQLCTIAALTLLCLPGYGNTKAKGKEHSTAPAAKPTSPMTTAIENYKLCTVFRDGFVSCRNSENKSFTMNCKRGQLPEPGNYANVTGNSWAFKASLPSGEVNLPCEQGPTSTVTAVMGGI